jgi:deoxyribose-phosphate aldolase
MFKFSEYKCSKSELVKRVLDVTEYNLPYSDRNVLLRKILACVDLTTLSGDDTNRKVKNLCEKAYSFSVYDGHFPNVAAVCVYPVFARLVHQSLLNTGIKTACVAGGFPSGQSPLRVRLDEVKFAIDQGAEEIDMVLSRGRLIEGDGGFVYKEIEETKNICKDVHLKVILETGELDSVQLVRKASEIAILAGADFLKTSTGKIHPSATPEAFLVMLDTIAEYAEKTGRMVGIKAAGGIAEPDDALLYLSLTKAVLGEKWLDKQFFRIGASRLADAVFDEISPEH